MTETRRAQTPEPISPEALPRVVHAWTADVRIAPMQDLGAFDGGRHFIVPILGGSFAGLLERETPDPIPFRGQVVAGGFDLQRQRADGVRTLEAIYHLCTDDGVTVEIRNRCLISRGTDGRIDYARSKLDVRAPDGRYDCLNRRIFVGSLQPLSPQPVVRIYVFALM